MAAPGTDTQQDLKTMLKAALAASFPALVAFVVLISLSVVDIVHYASLDRLGVAAGGVVALALAYLLWRGRWWAGLPSLALCAGGAVVFSLKFLRPLMRYLAVNPVRDFGDLTSPILLLSPALVLVVLCIILGLAIYRGVKLARRLQPRPVPWAAWGILFIWLAVMGGDYIYQQSGWRWFKSPSDLVVRLCSTRPELRREVENYLLEQGADAVPVLLLGMATDDADLDCLRQGCWSVLFRMGPRIMPQLLQAARQGSPEAVLALQGLGDRRAAGPLLQLYRDPKRKFSPQFEQLLKETIHKLNPSLKLE